MSTCNRTCGAVRFGQNCSKSRRSWKNQCGGFYFRYRMFARSRSSGLRCLTVCGHGDQVRRAKGRDNGKPRNLRWGKGELCPNPRKWSDSSRKKQKFRIPTKIPALQTSVWNIQANVQVEGMDEWCFHASNGFSFRWRGVFVDRLPPTKKFLRNSLSIFLRTVSKRYSKIMHACSEMNHLRSV